MYTWVHTVEKCLIGILTTVLPWY